MEKTFILLFIALQLIYSVYAVIKLTKLSRLIPEGGTLDVADAAPEDDGAQEQTPPSTPVGPQNCLPLVAVGGFPVYRRRPQRVRPQKPRLRHGLRSGQGRRRPPHRRRNRAR